MRQLICLLCCLIFCGHALADDWPQWRGLKRDGVSQESSQYPKGWPPEKLWTTKVGYGCTSPIFVGGRLYVMGYKGSKGGRGANPRGEDVIYCFDARSGKILWQQSYASRYQSRFRKGDVGWYGGPSGTPAIDTATDYLYALSIDGDLQCFNTRKKGQRVWGINLIDRYKVKQRPVSSAGHRDYGFTGSPLIYQNKVIVEVSAAAGSLMAFDKKTGKKLWASKYSKPAGHSSGPVVMRIGGRDAFAWLALFDIVVADTRGRTMATHQWITEFSTNIPTPAPQGNRLLVTTGYNRKQSRLFEVGQSSMRSIWKSKQHSTVTSPLIFNSRVYTIKKNVIEALRLADGKRLWRGKKFEHGSIIALDGDDKILACGSGSIALIDCTDKYSELSRIDHLFSSIAFPNVAISDGIIAAKDRDGNLAVLSVNPADR